MTELRRMVEVAGHLCGDSFEERGQIERKWDMWDKDGNRYVAGYDHLGCYHVMLPQLATESKDVTITFMRTAIKRYGIVRYVYVGEAWTPTHTASYGPTREVVYIQAEALESETIIAGRDIIRPEIGKPYLGPITIFDYKDLSMYMAAVHARWREEEEERRHHAQSSFRIALERVINAFRSGRGSRDEQPAAPPSPPYSLAILRTDGLLDPRSSPTSLGRR